MLACVRLVVSLLLLGLVAACSGASYCGELRTCCPEIGAQEVAELCASTAETGSNDECKVALRSVQGSGLCLGNDAGADTGPSLSPVCLSLSECCEQLEEKEQQPCYGALASNDTLVCQSALDGYVTKGSCPAP